MTDSSEIWKWIAEAKAAGATLASTTDSLDTLVRAQPRSRRATIAEGYCALQREADRLIVWEACSLFLGGTASDDSFEYFKNWLIWGGPRFFADAISKVDALADLCDIHGVDLSSPFFEPLGVLGSYSGASARRGMPNQRLEFGEFAARTWSWMDSSPAKIAADLPRLWSRYAHRFSWDPPALPHVASFDAPGLGVIQVGHRVRHKFGYGEGVITEVLVADTALATIKFADDSRPFRVTSDYFELIPSDTP
jgi:hypothetical protein